MILRDTYTVKPYTAVKEIDELPLELILTDQSKLTLRDEGDELRLVREFKITAPLEIEEKSGHFHRLDDGTKVRHPRIRVPDGGGPTQLFLEDAIDALSFLTDTALHFQSQGRGALVPETSEDQELIEKVRSDEPFSPTGAKQAIRTVSLEVNSENVQTLLDGPRVGVRLYADALRLPLATSRFRELWRVLESAFRRKEKALVKRIAEFKPALQLKFDEEELEELRRLRGRASHAETNKPDLELSRVEGLCDQKLPRLLTLIERVILTKKTWSAPTGGVRESPPPVMSYVGKKGEVVLIQNWKKQLQEDDTSGDSE